MMFNKKSLKEYLNKLNLDKEDFIIVAGGSLLLQNIKETTEDIDLYVNKKCFDKLTKLFEVKLSGKPYENHYIITDKLEVVLKNEFSKISYILIDGFKCSSLDFEYNWMKQQNRIKDRKTIKKLEKYFIIKNTEKT